MQTNLIGAYTQLDISTLYIILLVIIMTSLPYYNFIIIVVL